LIDFSRQLTAGDTFTTLYSFCSRPNCTDGADAASEVIQASDGNFYGATYGGGAVADGTVFELTPAGTLTTLNSFAGAILLNPPSDSSREHTW
jgi:uncharacterized repeat protein (TIGR03803 family)